MENFNLTITITPVDYAKWGTYLLMELSIVDYYVNTLTGHSKKLFMITTPDTEESEDEVMSAGNITIQTKQWLVSVSGIAIDLTYIEYLLLKALVVERGKVISRETLLERVWRYGNVSLLETRTVDVHVGRLRKKLGQAGSLIITVRNVGYRMAFSPEWISR